MKNICLISNNAPIYRKGIYRLIDNKYNTIWAFGRVNDIQDADTSDFRGTVLNLKSLILPFCTYWLKGCLRLSLKKDIDYYILIGDAKCLSIWLCAVVAKLRGKKVIFWSHGSLRRIKGVRKVLLNIFWSLADCGLIYNNRSRVIMRQAVPTCKNYVTVYNSLNYEKQLHIRKKLSRNEIYTTHFGNNNPVIAFIGRLIPSKKLDIIIRAISVINSNSYPLSLNVVMIGDGEEKDRLINLADELCLSNHIWFYGACYDEEKNAELLYNADICISPGEVGLTAIHSLMFGLPVATHNNLDLQGPEFEAIVENQTGFYFNENEIDDLCNRIIAWFTENADKRDMIRQNCFNVVDSIWNPKYQMSIIDDTLNTI